jgi:hypothetical protein
MPTRADPLLVVRVPCELLAEIDAAVQRYLASLDRVKRWYRRRKYTRSSWVIAAIRERLAKQARGRKRNTRGPSAPKPAETTPPFPQAVEGGF